MTVITLAVDEYRQLALVADRIYAPFSNPQFMVKPKIFRRNSIVVGVSGNICAVDLDRLLNGELIVGCSAKAHVIMINEYLNWIRIAKPCGNDEVSTWFDPIATGEPTSLGCFAHIADTGVYGEIPCLEPTLTRISHLHNAFGFSREADVIKLDMNYDKLIFDDVVESYFDSNQLSSLSLRRTSSTGLPFTSYPSAQDTELESGDLQKKGSNKS